MVLQICQGAFTFIIHLVLIITEQQSYDTYYFPYFKDAKIKNL